MMRKREKCVGLHKKERSMCSFTRPIAPGGEGVPPMNRDGWLPSGLYPMGALPPDKNALGELRPERHFAFL